MQLKITCVRPSKKPVVKKLKVKLEQDGDDVNVELCIGSKTLGILGWFSTDTNKVVFNKGMIFRTDPHGDYVLTEYNDRIVCRD
jgi:hypothetical protein